MSNADVYRKLCEHDAGIPIFLQAWWLDVVCDKWDVAITRKGDTVTGVWPYPVEQKLGVKILRNPVLTPYLGPHAICTDGLKGKNKDTFECDTVTGLMKQMPDAQVWQLALQPGMEQVGAFRSFGIDTYVRQTFMLVLDRPEEDLYKDLKETTRHNIRIGSKEITISDTPEAIGELYRLQQQTLERKGKKFTFPYDKFESLVKEGLRRDAAALWTAKKDGQTLAMLWQVWDSRCSYYFMGVRNSEVKDKRAVSSLLWHAITDAKRRGIPFFDFEGSIDIGVERFFRNFGGIRTLYMVLEKNKSPLWKLKQRLLD